MIEKMERKTQKVGYPIKIKGYEDNCPICYELWSKSSPWTYPCGHMLCEKCYLKQQRINRMCHICRGKYSIKKQKQKQKQKKRNKRRRNRYGSNSDSENHSSSRESWPGWNGWDD